MMGTDRSYVVICVSIKYVSSKYESAIDLYEAQAGFTDTNTRCITND